MLTDDELNAILTRLLSLDEREQQVALLRGWTRDLYLKWSAQWGQGERERLGMLGGG